MKIMNWLLFSKGSDPICLYFYHLNKVYFEYLLHFFIFTSAPTCLEELEDVLTGHSPSNQLTIIERMIKCHHPSLSDGNKAKLETLITCIYQLMGKYVREGKDLQPQFINGLTK